MANKQDNMCITEAAPNKKKFWVKDTGNTWSLINPQGVAIAEFKKKFRFAADCEMVSRNRQK